MPRTEPVVYSEIHVTLCCIAPYDDCLNSTYSVYYTSMFLTNQIAQLRVLDFTYTTSRAVSRRRKPPRTLILPENGLLSYLGKNSFQELKLYSYYLKA